VQGRGTVLTLSFVALAACGFEGGTAGSRDAGDGGGRDVGDSMPGATGYLSHTIGKSSNQIVTLPSTYVPGGTYVLAVSSKPFATVAGVAGLGTMWTPVADQCGARSQTGVSVYIARNPISSGNVIVTLSTIPTSAVAVLAIYGGSANTGTFATYNALDASTCSATSTSVDVSAYTFAIAASGPVVAAVATRAEPHTPGAGLVQRAQEMQGSSGNIAGIAIVDGLVTSVSGEFPSDVDVAAVAVELRP